MSIRLIDLLGRELGGSLGGGARPAHQALIPRSTYIDLQTGKVLGVLDPRSNADIYWIELATERSATYDLHIQTLQGGHVTQYRGYRRVEIEAGEVHYLRVDLSAQQGEIGFAVQK